MWHYVIAGIAAVVAYSLYSDYEKKVHVGDVAHVPVSKLLNLQGVSAKGGTASIGVLAIDRNGRAQGKLISVENIQIPIAQVVEFAVSDVSSFLRGGKLHPVSR